VFPNSIEVENSLDPDADLPPFEAPANVTPIPRRPEKIMLRA